eukprot:352223-Chlamydomonas_euryale.AAC.10
MYACACAWVCADVNLNIICAFNRMKTKLGLSSDAKPENVAEGLVKAAADALRGSDSLEVSEDGMRVKRKAPLADPETAKKVTM